MSSDISSSVSQRTQRFPPGAFAPAQEVLSMSRRSRGFGFDGFAACFGPMGLAFGSGRRGFGFKVFDRGDLTYMILRLLDKKPVHG